MRYDYLNETNRFRNWPGYLAGFLGAALLVGVTTVVFFPSWQASRVKVETAQIDETPQKMSTPMMIPGINKPFIRSIPEAPIDGDAEVIGLEVEGRYRAYLIESLTFVGGHVVNDLVGDVPVSVTYCDISDVTKVYSSDSRAVPIDLSLGGIYEDELVLQHGDKMYDHRDKTIPLLHYPFERTTWEKWKEAHPDTDVYTGDITRPDDLLEALRARNPKSTTLTPYPHPENLKAFREQNPNSTSGTAAEDNGKQQPEPEAETSRNSPVTAEKPELP